MSALSYVSVMPTEELDKLLQDVKNLGESQQVLYQRWCALIDI